MTQYNVQTSDGTLELSTIQLLDVLMSKHMQTEREDMEDISLEFTRFMQFKGTLAEASLQQLILISFSLGYFYRVFLEKNQVEVINESTDSEDSNSSGDSSSGSTDSD